MFLALSLLAALQDPPAGLRYREGTFAPDAWTLRFDSAMADGSEAALLVRRRERSWDRRESRFLGRPGDRMILRARGESLRKSIEIRLAAGTPGIYEILVDDGEEAHALGRSGLGDLEALLARSRDASRRLAALPSKILPFVEEIERLVAGKAEGTPERKAAFLREIAEWEAAAEKIGLESDFTGTASLLKDLILQIRNAQVWGRPPSPAADNDGLGTRSRIFLEEGLTIDRIKAILRDIPAIVSGEAVLTSAQFLLAAMERPDFGARGPGLVGAAMKLIEATPAPDAPFLELLRPHDREPDRRKLEPALRSLVADRMKEPAPAAR